MSIYDTSTGSLYSILGVDFSADFATIRTAYRRAALRTHPDKGGNPSEFRRVLFAFETLSNEVSRVVYDRRHSISRGSPTSAASVHVQQEWRRRSGVNGQSWKLWIND